MLKGNKDIRITIKGASLVLRLFDAPVFMAFCLSRIKVKGELFVRLENYYYLCNCDFDKTCTKDKQPINSGKL